MTRLPNPPSPGDNLSVSFFRQLWQYLRENRVVAGKNVSLSRGVGGMVIDCTATGKGKSGGVATITTTSPGCYELTATGKLRNQYYGIGGKYYRTTYDGQLLDTTGIVYLQINAADISANAEVKVCAAASEESRSQGEDAWGEFTKLIADDVNNTYYRIPLYMLKKGAIKIDFRNMPVAAMVEF